MRNSLPDVDYERPETMEELLKLITNPDISYSVLAGGTDLIIDIRSENKTPQLIIDLKGIKELQDITQSEGKGLQIGATATINDILKKNATLKKYTCLLDACSDLGDSILRSRATMGGNICTASPAGDSAPALIVLDARVEIAGIDGLRVVTISDFFTGVKKNCLKKGEIITKIIIPDIPQEIKSRYMKMKRGAEDLAIVGVAGIHFPDGKTTLAYSSVAPIPVKVDVTEEFKEGKVTENSIETAVKKALSHVSPISDVRGGKEYRNHLVDISTRFILNDILGGSEQ